MRFEGALWEYILFVLVGIIVGILIGYVFSILKSRFFKAETNRKLRNLAADFEKEKNTSDSILRELEVGILAYVDGRLVTGNPSAKSLLEVKAVPGLFSAFLRSFGQDNGIQAAVVLQTPDITGHIVFPNRIVRARLTQAKLSQDNSEGWIIILQDITEEEREEKQRKEFVANVSHELKTPLTTISAYSETLLEWGIDGKEKEEIKEDILRIHDDAARMDALVRNLLLLSSIDSRGIKPRMTQYDAVSIMRQVVSRMQLQAKEKEVLLESSVLSIIPPIYGDPSAFDRIITNLVSNGIKYTDTKGYVSVSVQLTNDYISLKVADNGMGVSKDNLSRLFDRFFRVDSTGSRKYGGTGLGLSIAKELTEIQGGTISVFSTLGKGTEFVVTIPKAEKTYHEVLTAAHDGVPRKEILYENAQSYLLLKMEELEMEPLSLKEIEKENEERLFLYLLSSEEKEVPDYKVVEPSEMLSARFEAKKRAEQKKEVLRTQNKEEKKLPPKGEQIDIDYLQKP